MISKEFVERVNLVWTRCHQANTDWGVANDALRSAVQEGCYALTMLKDDGTFEILAEQVSEILNMTNEEEIEQVFSDPRNYDKFFEDEEIILNSLGMGHAVVDETISYLRLAITCKELPHPSPEEVLARLHQLQELTCRAQTTEPDWVPSWSSNPHPKKTGGFWKKAGAVFLGCAGVVVLGGNAAAKAGAIIIIGEFEVPFAAESIKEGWNMIGGAVSALRGS